LQPVGVNHYLEDGFNSDASGENISNLNAYYCELTVMFWAWKNSQADFIGIYHYRRYLNFALDATWQSVPKIIGLPATKFVLDYLTSDGQHEKLRAVLEVYDVVVPKKYVTLTSIQDHYLQFADAYPWGLFLGELESRYPEHRQLIKTFYLSNSDYVCNIFVMPRNLFSKYCSELFEILKAVFDKAGCNSDAYRNRYPGFLAERFLGFWILVNRLRVFEAPLIILGE